MWNRVAHFGDWQKFDNEYCSKIGEIWPEFLRDMGTRTDTLMMPRG